MLPYDVIHHVLTFITYDDLPPWASVDHFWHGVVYPRLHSVYYPEDVQDLTRLCTATKEVILNTAYDGGASHLRILGNGYHITGIYRHCCIECCRLQETILIHCTVLHGDIRNGQDWFNVETNGRCRMEDVAIEYNTKGLVNMGYLSMYMCNIEYNTTGLESRGELSMEDCIIKHNSVGVHCTGTLDIEGNDMENNTINLLRTQPNRPMQRCWTQ